MFFVLHSYLAICISVIYFIMILLHIVLEDSQYYLVLEIPSSTYRLSKQKDIRALPLATLWMYCTVMAEASQGITASRSTIYTCCWLLCVPAGCLTSPELRRRQTASLAPSHLLFPTTFDKSPSTTLNTGAVFIPLPSDNTREIECTRNHYILTSPHYLLNVLARNYGNN